MKKSLVSLTIWTVGNIQKVLVVLLLFGLSIEVSAQPELLKDINTSLDMSSIQSRSFTRATTQIFYVNNAVLWVTKGSVSTTAPLKKFVLIYPLTAVGSSVFFAADDGKGSGVELWKSNGSVAGTVRVKDIFSGPSGSEPRNITVLSSTTIYFSANDGINGRELWKTNGTAAGTMMVKDIMNVKGSSNPSSICKVGGVIFFAANDGQNGIELWKSDGTLSGTVIAKNIRPGPKASSHPQLLTEVGGKLYFKANDGISGFELYKSDGTSEGTQMLKDIRVGVKSADVQNLINVNATLFFTANDGIHGDELWKSNGTPGSTNMVNDLNPGVGGSNNTSSERFPMGNFTDINGILFFTAGKGTSEEFIVRSDGTKLGTYRIADMKSIGYNALQPSFTYLNGVVYYFNKFTDVNGYDQYYLFRVDLQGNDLGALQQYRVPEPFYETFVQDIIAFDNMLLTSNLTNYGWEILRQSLTGETLVLDTGHGPTASSYPDPMVKAGNLVYFATSNISPDFVFWNDLWSTDGTTRGTVRIFEYAFDGFQMLPVGDKLFFTAGVELYVSQGRFESTFALISTTEPDPAYILHGLTNVNGVVYFYNASGELWKSDGTRAGTLKVRALHKILSITNVGGKAFVLNETEAGGLELWRTSTKGLSRVKVLRDGNATRSTHNPTAAIANKFYFVGNDGVHGNEVWQSDGTALGTTMVKDMNTADSVDANGNEADIRSFTVFNNKLYVSCMEGNEWKLLVVTGKNSTASVTRLRPVNKTIIYHNKVYIFTQGFGDAQSFWVTDGLIDGRTTLLGLNFYGDIDEAFVGDNLYFTTWSDRIMYQITDCGVFRMNIPEVPVIEGLGNALIYTGFRADIGYEPFIYHNIAAFTHSCAAADVRSMKQDETMITSWPNPYTTDFSVRIGGPSGQTVSLEVFNGSGFPIESIRNLRTNIDYNHIGSAWPAGLYIIKFHYGTSTSILRVSRK